MQIPILSNIFSAPKQKCQRIYHFGSANEERKRTPRLGNPRFHLPLNPSPHVVLQALPIGGLFGRSNEPRLRLKTLIPFPLLTSLLCSNGNHNLCSESQSSPRVWTETRALSTARIGWVIHRLEARATSESQRS
ncbi:hypothetical protein SLA2020_394520 [Shorea laevis]